MPEIRYAFDEFLLDPALRELRRNGELVHAEPQVFDLVLHLIRHRERVVSQDELRDVVWNGRLVSESTFRNRINAARKLVGDDGVRQARIRTVARRGLRFVAAVTEAHEGVASDDPASPGHRTGFRGEPKPTEWPGEEPPSSTDSASTDQPDRLPYTGTEPVVAVLPFANLSADAAQQHVADGITEDVITALARHGSLSVIARNTVFAFRDRAGDVRQLGRDLAADYIVEGSVRPVGPQVRVTAHLIETASGRLLWADRFDQGVESLLEVQDAITTVIVASIEPQIGSLERSRVEGKPPDSLKARDLFHLGTRHLYKATRHDNREAQRWLRLAVEHDGRLAQAHAHLAYAILLSMLYFDADPEEHRLDESLSLARAAMELDDQDAMIRFVYGRVLLARRSYGDALAELEQAVSLNPALAIAHCGVGDSLAYEGRYEEAFPYFERAIELSPHDPQRWAFHAYRAMAHLFARQFQQAADWARRAIRIPNCHYWPYSHRVAALGHLQSPAETKVAVAELLQQKPDFTCETARKRLFYIKDAEQLAVYLDGLRRAGIPERRFG